MIEVYNDSIKRNVYINPRYITQIFPYEEMKPFKTAIAYDYNPPIIMNADQRLYFSDKTPKEVVNQIVAFNRQAHLQITWEKPMEQKYYIIYNSDGDTDVEELTRQELLERLNAEEYGDVDFLDWINDSNPNYWEGKLLIIKGEIVVPKEKKTVTGWDI